MDPLSSSLAVLQGVFNAKPPSCLLTWHSGNTDQILTNFIESHSGWASTQVQLPHFADKEANAAGVSERLAELRPPWLFLLMGSAQGFTALFLLLSITNNKTVPPYSALSQASGF